MKKNITVCAVQMKILSARRNLPVVLDYIEKASKLKADVVCFPECAFNPHIRKPASKKDLDQIQKSAGANNVFVIINGYFKVKNKKVFNRTYLVGNTGKILGFYDKIYPWVNELGYIERGKLIKVIKTSLGNIGFCTCWDLFFPKMFEELKNKGAEIVFCPSYWKDEFNHREAKFLEYAPTVTAYEYMFFFVYCNAFLKGKTSVSQIAAPWGELAKIKYREGMIKAEIYFRRLKRFKNHFRPVFYERRFK